jgi:integrase
VIGRHAGGRRVNGRVNESLCYRVTVPRGYIRERPNGTFQVIVYAGKDPLTGKERRPTGTRATRREAEQLLTTLLAQVDTGRSRGSKRATVAEVIGAWLETSDHEFTTRNTYEGYIKSKILPALGNVQARKIDVETLDRFYTELRKRGGRGGRPLAASTVRQIHFILRASLGLAVKWGWIPENPAERATVPRYVRTDVVPPSPEDVTRFLEAARQRDPDFETLLWLAMITGARRAELCGLRWPHVFLDGRYLIVARSVVNRGRDLREKDTKTHQARRIGLDEGTTALLTEHRKRCEERAAICATTVRHDGFVFSLCPDGADPLVPDSVTNRIKRLSDRLGVHVTLRGLRHYAATELLTGGVDLRTVAGRLGHAGGGATTLRVYTHFMPTPDQQAAELLAQRIPRPDRESPAGQDGSST